MPTPKRRRGFASRALASKQTRRVGAVALSTAILAAGSGAVAPAHAAGPTPESLNAAYAKVKAELESATQPKPSPLEGMMPAAGSPLDQSISELQSDLKDFLPGGKLPAKNPNDPNLLNQNPASTTNQQLNITVAKAVLVAADATGSPNMNVLLANTQVSGNGSGTVKVPVGTTKAKNSSGFAAPPMEGEDIVYNVSNSGNTLQTFGASNGNYTGQLPVKVDVQAWVDGQPVAPADMVNVSGHVRLTYTFTNMTAEMTKISFRGPDGSVITQEKEIPIPFGGAFIVTLPQQFADVNAPWAEGGVSPLGTTLSGTIMLIPPLGASTQSVTIDARAENASLPGSSFQALPLTLTDNGIGKLAYGALPVIGDVANVATAAGAFGQADLAKLQALVMKYGAVAAGISDKYIQPLIKAFQDGQVDAAVAKGEAQLVALDQAADDLALLLPQAQFVIGAVSGLLNQAIPQIEANIGTINQLIDLLQKISTSLDNLLPEIEKAAAYLTENLASYLTKGTQVATWANKTCPEIKDITDEFTLAEIDEVFDVVIALVGPDSATGQKLTKIKQEVNDFYGIGTETIDACVQYAPEILALLELALANVDVITDRINGAVKDLAAIVPMVDTAAKKATNFEKNEAAILKQLDNNDCPKTPSGIKNCGVMQQISFLNDMMKLASSGVQTQMKPGLDQLVSYLPAVNKFVGLADTYVPIFGAKIEAMIPQVFSGVEGALDKGDAALAKFTSEADKAQITVASYTAQLEIMNARAQSGQGLPAGPAQGANTNLGAYQYQIAGANSQADQTYIMFGLAGILILLSAGLGTVMYNRNKR